MVLFRELTITCMIVNDHENAFFVIKTWAGLGTNTTSLPANTTHAWPFKICFYWQSRAWWFRIFPCVNAVPVYKRKQNEAQLPILTEQFNYIYAVIAKPLSEHKLRLCMLQLIWYSNYSRHLLIIWKRGIIFVMIKLTFSYYISVINSSLFIFIEWINMSCYSIYNTIVMVKN